MRTLDFEILLQQLVEVAQDQVRTQNATIYDIQQCKIDEIIERLTTAYADAKESQDGN